MRVCIVFWGRVRGWWECYKNYRRCIYDPLVALVGSENVRVYLAHNANNTRDFTDEFCQFYNSHMVSFLPPPDAENKYRGYLQHDAWRRVCQLAEEDGKFDLCISMRADMNFSVGPDFADVGEWMDKRHDSGFLIFTQTKRP
jgi:hypothetical protein